MAQALGRRRLPALGCFLLLLLLLLLLLAFLSTVGADADADAGFTASKAAYYPNSDTRGTDNGACEYGLFGATLNDGNVAASASLYKDGVGCGTCYQVRCTDSYYRCAPAGVTVVITDSGESANGTGLILSQRAFASMGQGGAAAAALLAVGHVGIQYRRVSCSYPGKNIAFKVMESSHFPYYLEFQIWYQQDSQDIIAVQLCETVDLTCQLLSRTHGAVWAAVSPPSGPLSVRMLLSGGAPRGGGRRWLVPANSVPQNWTAGGVYDSGVQVQPQQQLQIEAEP